MMYLTGVWLHEDDPPYLEFIPYSDKADSTTGYDGFLRRHPVNPNRMQVARMFNFADWAVAFEFNTKQFLARGDSILERHTNQRVSVGRFGEPIALSWEQIDYEPDPVFEGVRLEIPCGEVYYFEEEEFKWLLDALEFEL